MRDRRGTTRRGWAPKRWLLVAWLLGSSALLCTARASAQNTDEAADEQPAEPPGSEGSLPPDGESPEGDPVIGLPIEQDTTGLPPELARNAGKSEGEVADQTVTVETLVNPEVVSVSKSAESARNAPAWVISLSRQELHERGYTDLSQLLNDLPSMDLSRPYGQIFTRAYWRGYRSYPGEPYILMVDGVIYNHMWLNDGQIMATIPMSNVARVEVVNGPSSVQYGANAAMGVINIITCKPIRTQADDLTAKGDGCDERPAGASAHTRVSLSLPTGAPSWDDTQKTFDAYALYKHPLSENKNLLLSMTGRGSFGRLDSSIGDNYYFTRSSLYTDAGIWGDYANANAALGGGFHSPIEQLGLDTRVAYDSLELVGQLYRQTTGAGTMFPGDRQQVNVPWTNLERSLYARHNHDVLSWLNIATMLRYRDSSIVPPSADVYRDPADATGEPTLEYATAHNWGFIVTQDITANIAADVLSGDLRINSGYRFEHRDMERGYVGSTTPISDYLYQADNREASDNVGAYVVARYELVEQNFIYAGLRLDYFGVQDVVEPTFRGGYVASFPPITLKALYGQAIQEPTARQLFVSWGDSDDEPTLALERSQTIEVQAEYADDYVSIHLGGYYVGYANPIVEKSDATAVNLDTRNIIGVDTAGFLFVPLGDAFRLKLWGYFTAMPLLEESDSEGTGEVLAIPDIATFKLRGGVTFTADPYLDLNLMARWDDARPAIQYNPLGEVPANFTLDMTVSSRPTSWLGISLRGTNLLDAAYSHPGVSIANAGGSPNNLTSLATSAGRSLSSRLPQPGRALQLTVDLDLEAKIPTRSATRSASSTSTGGR